MRFRVNIQHFSDGYITLIDHFDVIGPLPTYIVCRRLFRNEATKQQIIVCSDSHDARNIKHIWIFSPVMSLNIKSYALSTRNKNIVVVYGI